MNNLPPAVGELYNDTPVSGNAFQLVGDLFGDIRETTEARRKVIREIAEETMSFRINLFEKLALHFSKEAMLAERKRKVFLALFDMLTFNKPKNNRW